MLLFLSSIYINIYIYIHVYIYIYIERFICILIHLYINIYFFIHVCNWDLDERSDMDELDVQTVVSRLASGQMLQIYSDGGFDGVCGAASVVLVFNTFEGGVWHASTGGYRGVYISSARSAFQAELIGADAAISFAIELGRELRRRHTCN